MCFQHKMKGKYEWVFEKDVLGLFRGLKIHRRTANHSCEYVFLGRPLPGWKPKVGLASFGG